MRSKSLSKNLIPKKHLKKGDVNTSNSLRKNSAFFAKYVCDDINASIHSSKLHVELKEANIIPVHKKKSNLCKANYEPISILQNNFKVLRRMLI